MKISTTILFIFLFIPSIFAHKRQGDEQDNPSSKRSSREDDTAAEHVPNIPTSQEELTGFNNEFHDYQEGLAAVVNQHLSQRPSQSMYPPARGEASGSNLEHVSGNIQGSGATVPYPSEQFPGQYVHYPPFTPFSHPEPFLPQTGNSTFVSNPVPPYHSQQAYGEDVRPFSTLPLLPQPPVPDPNQFLHRYGQNYQLPEFTQSTHVGQGNEAIFVNNPWLDPYHTEQHGLGHNVDYTSMPIFSQPSTPFQPDSNIPPSTTVQAFYDIPRQQAIPQINPTEETAEERQKSGPSKKLAAAKKVPMDKINEWLKNKRIALNVFQIRRDQDNAKIKICTCNICYKYGGKNIQILIYSEDDLNEIAEHLESKDHKDALQAKENKEKKNQMQSVQFAHVGQRIESTSERIQQTELTLEEKCKNMIEMLDYTSDQMSINIDLQDNLICTCHQCKNLKFFPQNEKDIENHVNSQSHIDALKTIKSKPTKTSNKIAKIKKLKQINERIKQNGYLNLINVLNTTRDASIILCQCTLCKNYRRGFDFQISDANGIDEHINSDNHQAALKDKEKQKDQHDPHVGQATEFLDFGAGTQEYGGHLEHNFDPQPFAGNLQGMTNFQPPELSNDEAIQMAIVASRGGVPQRNLNISGRQNATQYIDLGSHASHGRGTGSRSRGSGSRSRRGSNPSNQKDKGPAE